MQLTIGQRIELVAMADDPDPVAPGTRGTVRSVESVGSGRDAFVQVDVAWDDGRELMLCVPPDRCRLIDD